MFLGFNQGTTLKNSDTTKDLELSEKYGFDFIEFQMGPLYAYLENHTANDLKDFFDNNRIKPYALNVLEYFNLKTKEEFREMEKEFIRMCEIAATIGSKVIILVQSRKHKELTLKEIKEDSLYCIDRFLEIIDSKNFDIKLSYEFLGFSDFSVNNFAQCYEIVQDVNNERVGITLDCFHFHASASKIDDLKEADAKKIFCFHIDDAKDKPLCELVDADRVWPGDGVIPFDRIFPVLKDIGFDGVASIELFNSDYWKWSAEETVKVAKEKLETIIRKYF